MEKIRITPHCMMKIERNREDAYCEKPSHVKDSRAGCLLGMAQARGLKLLGRFGRFITY